MSPTQSIKQFKVRYNNLALKYHGVFESSRIYKEAIGRICNGSINIEDLRFFVETTPCIFESCNAIRKLRERIKSSSDNTINIDELIDYLANFEEGA